MLIKWNSPIQQAIHTFFNLVQREGDGNILTSTLVSRSHAGSTTRAHHDTIISQRASPFNFPNYSVHLEHTRGRSSFFCSLLAGCGGKVLATDF